VINNWTFVAICFLKLLFSENAPMPRFEWRTGMKNNFLHPFTVWKASFSIVLAATVMLSGGLSNFADASSLWNPKHWLDTNSPESSATEAVKRAEQAQQAADVAMKNAQNAMQKAAEARRQAEALEASPHKRSKKMVINPAWQAQTSTHSVSDSKLSQTDTAMDVNKPADSEPTSEERVYQSKNPAPEPSTPNFSAVGSKREVWNPLTWFQKDSPKSATSAWKSATENTENPSSAASSPQTHSQPSTNQDENAGAESGNATDTTSTNTSSASSTSTSTTSANGSGGWHLRNFFGKSRPTPSPETGQKSEVEQKTEQQPQPQQSSESELHNTVNNEGQPQAPQTEQQSTDAPNTNASAPEAQPEAGTEQKNTTATDASSSSKTQEEASSKTDKGGWNLLNILSKPEPSKTQKTKSPAQTQPTVQAQETTDPTSAAETDQALKNKAALIETEKGNVAIELYPDQAPLTVANFVKLINEGFYNRFNMRFHRVEPGFVVQTGDPTGTGAGGSKEHIPLEAKNKLSHNAKGIVAMARGADPDSATSQFYITLTPQTSLDGKYAVFGKVISGLDVLDKIEKNDMLYGIRLVSLSSVVRDPQPEKKKFFSSLF
jgi:peptidyl-prolyl cis-trans isomerase B (cyclophilin B)